jgi:hypothetical protein
MLLALGSKYGLIAILINGLFLTVFHEAIMWVLIGIIMGENDVLVIAKEK